jgi:hypothetical protein
MKKYLITLLSACLCSLSINASAADHLTSGGQAFVGAGVGIGSYVNPLADSYTALYSLGLSTIESGPVWQLNTGYLWYTPDYAYGLEGLYMNLNNENVQNVSAPANYTYTTNTNINSLSLLAVGKMFLSQSDFYVSAKVGAAVQQQAFKSNSTQTNVAPQTTNTIFLAPAAGAGIGYEWAHWGWTLDGLYIDDRGTNTSRLITFTSGFIYRF